MGKDHSCKVAKMAYDKLNHAYMIYVEAAKGNLLFIAWLLTKNRRFDQSVYYGVFHSGMAGMMEVISGAAKGFPVIRTDIVPDRSGGRVRGFREKNNKKKMVLNISRPYMASFIEDPDPWHTTHLHGICAHGSQKKRILMYKDLLRIAVNRGNRVFMEYIEEMSNRKKEPCDADYATDSLAEHLLYDLSRCIWNVFLHRKWYCLGVDEKMSRSELELESEEEKKRIERAFVSGMSLMEVFTGVMGGGALYHAANNGHIDLLLWVRDKIHNYCTGEDGKRKDKKRAKNNLFFCGVLTGVLQGALKNDDYEGFLALLEGGYTIRSFVNLCSFIRKHPDMTQVIMDCKEARDLVVEHIY